MSKYIVDILDKDKYALEVDIMRNGSPASQRILDAVNVGTPYEERPHGEWIPIRNRKGTVVALRCSACGQSPKYAIKSDFCPRCGADMRIKNVRSWDTSSRGVSGSVENSITQKEGDEK